MINRRRFSEKLRTHLTICALLSCLFTFGCYYGKKDPIDRQVGMTRSDYMKAMIDDKIKKNTKADLTPAPLRKTSRMLATPSAPAIGGEKLLSLSVTEQVPLKDVLIELGRISKIDIDIDPNISGGVILNAKNRPLREIIERICYLGDLRYKFENNVLYFERDLPYAKHYAVDYLIADNLWGEVESNLGKMVSDSSGSNASSSGTTSSSNGSSSVSVNKVAGIITVFANSKKQKEVEKYLEFVRKNFSAQVLIEAKVIEVTLNDEYKTGIDWTWGRFSTNGVSAIDTTAGNAISFVLPSTSQVFGSSLQATINALEKFGTVRAIASPRINALNNQPANLNFTNQLIYFTIQIQSNTTTAVTTGTSNNTGSNTATTVTSTKHDENIGVELSITPSINLKTNEITLNVHPKLSTKGAEVQDPATVNTGQNDSNGQPIVITNTIPEINTREITTTMKVESGGTLVIGGLMGEDTSNTDTGIPYLSRIPFLGNLFKSAVKESTIVETVIFIKATIINSANGVDKYDRELHDKFDTNKRSLFN